MSDEATARRLDRRDFLRYGGWGALVLAAGGAVAGVASGRSGGRSVPKTYGPTDQRLLAGAGPTSNFRRFAATDGHILLPGRDPLYVFGFVDVEPQNALDDPVADVVNAHKGLVKVPAPILEVKEGEDLYLTLTNVGLVARPDLDDSHTIHWHGFRNPLALFDGVPEASISVPVNRDFPYFYPARNEGTYMYHCHFEDVEHVTMGMTGVVFVRPTQYGTPFGGYTRHAYDSGDGTTGYDRPLMIQ